MYDERLIHLSIHIFHRILVMRKICALDASNSLIVHHHFQFKRQAALRKGSLGIVMKQK